MPHTERAIREGGEEKARVRPERGAEIRIPAQLEQCAAYDHGQDLDITQLRHKTAVPYGTSHGERPIMFLYQTVHRHDKYCGPLETSSKSVVDAPTIL